MRQGKVRDCDEQKMMGEEEENTNRGVMRRR